MPSAIDTTLALVSLAETQEYLKVSGSAEDAILGSLINSASAWVNSFLKRRLLQTSYVEYYSGDGSAELVLRNYPIVSVTSVYVDGLRDFGSTTLIDSDNIIIKKGTGILRAFDLLYGWECGDSNIKVTYAAGYALASMPYEVRLAVKRIVDNQYRLGYTHRKLDYQTESMQQVTTTFKDFDVPKDVRSMLMMYRSSIPAPQFEYAD